MSVVSILVGAIVALIVYLVATAIVGHPVIVGLVALLIWIVIAVRGTRL